MAELPDDKDFRKRMGRIETLVQEIERFRDPEARAHAREFAQTLLELHSVALERMLEHLAAVGNTGLELIDSLARDDLVGSLLLLYGLHPVDIETRVRLALEKARPHLRSQGGTVELLGVAGGVARLRLRIGIDPDGSLPTMNLKRTIEDAIYDKAPDVTAIEVEEITETRAEEKGRARFALSLVQRG
jgi:Fe-S cluster biogenesis protein NfuA